MNDQPNINIMLPHMSDYIAMLKVKSDALESALQHLTALVNKTNSGFLIESADDIAEPTPTTGILIELQSCFRWVCVCGWINYCNTVPMELSAEDLVMYNMTFAELGCPQDKPNVVVCAHCNNAHQVSKAVADCEGDDDDCEGDDDDCYDEDDDEDEDLRRITS